MSNKLILRNRKLALVLFVVLGFSMLNSVVFPMIARADSSPLDDIDEHAASVPRDVPTFLWKATKGKDKVYLLGTIHGAISQLYPLPSAIDQALDESKHLMVEISIDRADPAKVSKLIHQLGQYTPPDHLSQHLTPETKLVFEKYLAWSGDTWEMYEKFKPFYAAGMAAQSKRWLTSDLKFRSSLGLDLYLLARAREDGKVISDLETIEQQLHIEADLSDAAQDRLLRTSILHLNDATKQLQGYLDAWKAGDDVKMEELANSRSRGYPELREYEKALLDDRNAAMLNKINQLIKTKPGPHLVAVGAAHLVGKNGLVALFEQDGYSVERIMSTTNDSSVSSKKDNKIFPERFKIWLPSEPKRSSEKDTVRYEVFEPPNGAFLVCVFTSPTEPRDWPVPPPLMLDKLISIFKPDPGTRKSFTLQGYPGREIECSSPALKPGGASGASSATTGAGSGKPSGSPNSPGGVSQSGKPVGAIVNGSSAEHKAVVPGGGFGLGAAFAKIQAKDVKAKIRVYLAGRRFYLLCAVGGKSFLVSENVEKFFDSLELLSN